MRATVVIAAVSLLQLVSAQPHRRHAHQAAHVKKDVVTVVNTIIAEATAEPEVVVYVDQSGNPISTTTIPVEAVVVATHFPAPPVVPTVAPVVAIEAKPTTTSSSSTTSVYVAPTTSASPVAEEPKTSTSSAVAASSPVSVPTGNGYGFTYSPYNSDKSCKSASQVLQDFNAMDSGYSFVRTYGTDCNTVSNVLAAAQSKGLKLFAGIYDVGSATSEVQSILSAVGGDCSSLMGVGVGNEVVNQGGDPNYVMSQVDAVRKVLRAAGCQIPVVTVDTLVATRNNPVLCDKSDFCAVNCHPFFDGNTEAGDSGDFLNTQIASLRSKLVNSNQNIIIMETGWPSQGDTNKKAVPSPQNQKDAIKSIKNAFASNPGGVTLFSPFNMYWKTSDASQFNAEPYWGYLGDCPTN